jgi:hypothetical protein
VGLKGEKKYVAIKVLLARFYQMCQLARFFKQTNTGLLKRRNQENKSGFNVEKLCFLIQYVGKILCLS